MKKELLELIEKGAIAEVYLGTEGWDLVTTFMVGLAVPSGNEILLVEDFPEDQHHLHSVTLDGATMHNPASFELLSGNHRLSIAGIEDDDDQAGFEKWLSHYKENKERYDRFIQNDMSMRERK